ncbi:Uncharacterised protein [Salmonella enterica subsp. enterica serovar Bovismorbificans]|uniref:Uncharacterized protein n=1 Tax=Salmonella enterica subsp. enterica serovar Bovismorbificans TaxID=58097 RepID=A0A655DAG9_SALET|nr:Uncharacterised protein [Salmonella enterica subsp. enterica serovar Bovismorbificans]
MTRRTKGIFSFFGVGKQRFGKRRRNIIEIFVCILMNARRDIFSQPQRILKKPQRHAHIVNANVQRGVGIDKGVEGKVFI